MAIHLTEGNACGIVKSGNAQARLVVSTEILQSCQKSGALTFWRLYFLLFVFTFKVGKSYENSVNHGGNTSHQTDDKIDCHTYAFLVNYFQEKLIESFACKTR